MGISQKDLSKRPVEIWDILKAIVAIALLGYVVSQTNFDEILKLGSRFSWGWFGITFLFFCAMVIIKAVQYYLLLERRLAFLRVLEIVVLQNALMNFVATAAGIASYLTILGREKDVRLGRATVSFMFVKMGDLMAVSVFLLLLLFLVAPLPPSANKLFWVVTSATLFVVVIFFLTIFARHKFSKWARSMSSYLGWEENKFAQKVVKLLDAMAQEDQKRILKFVLRAFMLSLIYAGLTLGWGYARLRMFSFNIDPGVVFFVTSILQIASWIPIYILGGLGISESMSVYLFGLFGANKVEVGAIMIGVRLVFYLMNAFLLLYWPFETIIRAGAQRTHQDKG